MRACIKGLYQWGLKDNENKVYYTSGGIYIHPLSKVSSTSLGIIYYHAR
jgi:hypothetical protein